MRIAGLLGMVSVISGTMAAAADPIVLRDMGSFYVGGRTVTIAGEPVREVPLPGGQRQRVDHNGTYSVEQMYVQYVLPQNLAWQVSAADVAWRWADRSELRDHAGRARGLAQHVRAQWLGRVCIGRRGTRPSRLGHA